MDLPVILMAVAVGACLLAALMHGPAGIERRPRDRVRIAAAAQALAVAAGAAAVIALHLADTMHQQMDILRWALLPAQTAWLIASVWLVAFFAGVRRLRRPLALTAVLCAVVALDAALPTGLLHNDVGVVTTSALEGARISDVVMPRPHPLMLLADAAALAAFAFMYAAARRTYLRGEREKGLVTATVVTVFLVVAVMDALHGYGAVWDTYVTQLACTLLVVGVSIALRRQSSRAESELALYREQLEAVAHERLEDLEAANERLARESRERLAVTSELRRRVAELDGLQRISRMLAERRDLDSALHDVAPVIADFLEADDVRILLGDQAVDGDPPAGEQAQAPRPPAAAPVVTEVPLIARGRSLGRLRIARGDGAPEDLSPLAQIVADDVAVTVENELLHSEQTREAAAEERQRIARDLHDAVTQTVYSAALIAEALPAVWERDEQEGRQNLERLRRLVKAALAEMRSLLFELRPAALEAAPLSALLAWLGDSLGSRFMGRVDVRAGDDVELPTAVKLALYRVAQEASSNAIKHARADRLELAAHTDGQGAVVLRVRDDGCGFDPTCVSESRMGIRMMNERMDDVGADLLLESGPGGTTVTATWPGTRARAHQEEPEVRWTTSAL